MDKRNEEFSFTDKILQTSPLPATFGDELVAERLLLLVHFGADFNIWSGKRLVRYWDAFSEQCRAACYHGSTLASWWSHISETLPSAPRNSLERAETVKLLSEPWGTVGVLDVFRTSTPLMILRTRVNVEHYRETRENGKEER